MAKADRFSMDSMKQTLGFRQELIVASDKPEMGGEVVEHIKRLKHAVVLPVGSIVPDPEQPRKNFKEEDLQRLASSLKTETQLQPITVIKDRSSEEPRYIIMAGERRWRAAQIAGLETLNAVIEKKRLTTEQKMIRQYAENAIRADLDPLEKAVFYRQLIDSKACSVRELAKDLHTSAASVSRTMKLLEFPEDIQQLISEGKVPPTVAYKVLKIEGEEQQRAYIQEFVAGDITSSEIGANAKKSSTGRPKKSAKPRTNKTKTIDGLKVVLTSKERLSQVEIAQRLRKYADSLEGDGRARRAA